MAEIQVRLQPRAASTQIVGERDGSLVVRVTAPPTEGRANTALCKLIAKRARVAAGRVSVIRGERSRLKTLRVEGIDGAELRSRLFG